MQADTTKTECGAPPHTPAAHQRATEISIELLTSLAATANREGNTREDSATDFAWMLIGAIKHKAGKDTAQTFAQALGFALPKDESA